MAMMAFNPQTTPTNSGSPVANLLALRGKQNASMVDNAVALGDTFNRFGENSRAQDIREMIGAGGLEGLNEAQARTKIMNTAGGALSDDMLKQMDTLYMGTRKADEMGHQKSMQEDRQSAAIDAANTLNERKIEAARLMKEGKTELAGKKLENSLELAKQKNEYAKGLKNLQLSNDKKLRAYKVKNPVTGKSSKSYDKLTKSATGGFSGNDMDIFGEMHAAGDLAVQPAYDTVRTANGSKKVRRGENFVYKGRKMSFADAKKQFMADKLAGNFDTFLQTNYK